MLPAELKGNKVSAPMQIWGSGRINIKHIKNHEYNSVCLYEAWTFLYQLNQK